ncbi:MAG: Ni/Fe-hydrogenase, b-type cytochrome subunit [bacterium]
MKQDNIQKKHPTHPFKRAKRGIIPEKNQAAVMKRETREIIPEQHSTSLMKEETRGIIPQKQWTAAMCINHWSMAISIVMLIITGFYIARPFTVAAGETYEKYMMANMRFIHIICGLILTAICVWRLYLAFFSRFHADWKDFFAWLDLKNLYKNIKFYALVSNKPPKHTALYGPLQSLAYGFILVMIFFEVVTGLILYGALHQAGLAHFVYMTLGPIETIGGGLAGIRLIHHVLTWLIIIFICIHTYMAFWYDIVFKEGSISSIVSGIIFKNEKV